MTDSPDPVLDDWLSTAVPGRALDLGTGAGEAARWLARRGFAVETVDRDPRRLRALRRTPGVTVRQIDLRTLDPEAGVYDVITALAVLHFLEPPALAPLAARLQAALRPGGLLLASVFSLDDPAFRALQRSGQQPIAPATWRTGPGDEVLHFFARGELPALFPGLHLEHEQAARWIDPRADGGFRAGLTYVGRRRTLAGGV